MTGAVRLTDPVIGPEMPTEPVIGSPRATVPVTGCTAGKFETTIGAVIPTDPVTGPVSPMEPVTDCTGGKFETWTGEAIETEPVTETVPDTGTDPEITVTTGPPRPSVPVTKSGWVAVPTASEPETIETNQGELIWPPGPWLAVSAPMFRLADPRLSPPEIETGSGLAASAMTVTARRS